MFMVMIIDSFGCRMLSFVLLFFSVMWIGICCMILVKFLVVFFVGRMLKCELVVGVRLVIWFLKVWFGSILVMMVIVWLVCICVSWFFLKLVLIYRLCVGIRESSCVLLLMKELDYVWWLLIILLNGV